MPWFAGIMVGSRDCYCLCLAGITVFTDVLLTNSYHYFIFYILLCLILSFISYNRIAAGGSLTLAYLHPLNTINEHGKLERSGKLKINSTSKSCRRFLNYIPFSIVSQGSIKPRSSREKAYHTTIRNPDRRYHASSLFASCYQIFYFFSFIGKILISTSYG